MKSLKYGYDHDDDTPNFFFFKKIISNDYFTVIIFTFLLLIQLFQCNPGSVNHKEFSSGAKKKHTRMFSVLFCDLGLIFYSLGLVLDLACKSYLGFY